MQRRLLLAPPLCAPLALLLVALIRLLLIFPFTPERLVVDQPPEPADAIVVLEGAGYRIRRAVELVAEGYAPAMILPGLTEWSRGVLEREAAAASVVLRLLEPDATATDSTFEEAVNTRRLLADYPHIQHLIVVTSDYHSYRTQWTFRRVLPARIRITMAPVRHGHWSPDLARGSGPPARLFRREQVKFLGYFVLYGWRIY